MNKKQYLPHLIAFELTKKCTLSCLHCRAFTTSFSKSSDFFRGNFLEELTTSEILKTLEEIASFAKSIIILTGGEAILHKDIFKIIRYGRELGLTMVISSCGTTLDRETILKLKDSGIKRVSISIDGRDVSTHDYIRGEDGVFDKAVRAIKLLKENNLEFQINTTITKFNFNQVEDILDLAIKWGAVSFHPFFLVPVGRARHIVDAQLSADQYEDLLKKLFARSLNSIVLRPICAPHYFRISRQRKARTINSGLKGSSIGCMGGKSFCFISSKGKVQICGFMEVECGDIRRDNFRKIWYNSTIFNQLRDFKAYKGKCKICEYIEICSGCRARAFERYDDYLAQEPLCIYQPEN